MAPPTPVLVKEEVNRVFESVTKRKGSDCTLSSLTQFECSFDGGLVSCVPFKRLFQDCILANGDKQRIEITDVWTNNNMNDATELSSFLHAKDKVREIYEQNSAQNETS